MTITYTIIFYLFGTLMGSFLTVVGLRLPKEESFITTRSHCDTCGHVLALYDMIPILSYLFYRGRCHYCHKKIDPISTYCELFTGLLYAIAYYIFGFSYELFIALGIVSLLMIVVVSDTTYLVIPDKVLIFFAIYFIIIQILNLGIKEAGIKVLSGIFLFSVMYLIMLLGNKIFKKESLGGGDIKMMFIFGLLLDPLLGTLSIFLGSLIALPVSLILLYRQNERVIPFGPFLLLALVCIYFSELTTPQLLEFFHFS